MRLRIKANTAPPGICLSTVQGVLNNVAQYCEVIAPEGLEGLIVSVQTPTVDDRDKVWLSLNTSTLTPIGFYKWVNDEWLLVPAQPLNTLLLYTGAIADIPAGYRLADGTNGTVNLTNNTQFASLWHDNYDVARTTYTLCPIQFVGHDG